MALWPVQDAKAHFDEMIERARTEGPQTVMHDGAEWAVMLSIEDYQALSGNKPDFITHLLDCPVADEFVIERDRDTGRPVDL